MRRSTILLMALAAAGCVTGEAAAQVMVAPAAVFVNDASRFGSYLVLNQSDARQEVVVSFRFGYPVADSTGETRMVYGDTLPVNARSANAWVQAFPRQFTLEPGQQQLVRISVRPPANLDPGVFWTRIVTTSTPASARVDTLAQGIAANVIFRLEQVTTLLYKRGSLETQLQLVEPRAVVGDSIVRVFAPLRHSGNAPFFGKTTVTVFDAAGARVAESTEAFALYVDMTKRFDFSRKTLPPGSYTAEIRVVAEREDIPREELFPIEPINQRITFVVR